MSGWANRISSAASRPLRVMGALPSWMRIVARVDSRVWTDSGGCDGRAEVKGRSHAALIRSAV